MLLTSERKVERFVLFDRGYGPEVAHSSTCSMARTGK